MNSLEQASKNHIWYPFTQMQEYLSEQPVIIERGEGNYIFDIHGKKYLDGVSSIWTNVHGHNKKELNDAIIEQTQKISHSTLLGLSNVPAVECAELLTQITPKGLNRVFYSDSGSTAMEIALKIAYQYFQQTGQKQRTKFVGFKNAYHGDTIGSVSVGGIDLFHEVYRPLLFETHHAESPYCYRCPFQKEKESCSKECFTALEKLIETHHDELVAVVIEPLVQGAGGIITQPKGFLTHIRQLCDQYGILMIADEVAVGFGKTGTIFACENEAVIPDIMAVAKGISGGYLPLAATIVKDKIFEGFLGKHEEFKTFFHGHTFTGNPLACAVSIANMKIFQAEKTIEKLQPRIEQLTTRLNELKNHNHVGDIRQCGIMTGIELVEDKATKKSYKTTDRIGKKVIEKAREKGLIIRPLGDVIVLMPPLSITEEEMDFLCDVTFEAIDIITNK
jgi:adenosylmethionine-8-amino-7-oxononanoate aminotransferase